MLQLEKNLVEVKKYTPQTAERIAAAVIPAGYGATTGTDGSATFVRLEGQLDWLGQTSMPRASAPGLIAAFEARSGLGLSIGTGYEWKAFAEKLPPTQALFVYDPDPALLRMALTICDLSTELGAGKIVIVSGEAAAELRDFLEKHPGYEAPAVLHPLPTIEPSRRNTLLAAGEAIVRQALLGRQELVAKLIAEVAALAPAGDPIALLVTARHPFERPLHALATSRIPAFFLDRHDTASLAYRLELLTRHRPREVFADFFRAELVCIPRGIGVRTFVPPLVGPGFWLPGRLPSRESLAPTDRIVVHFQVHQALLKLQGIQEDRIEIEGLPVEPSMATAEAAGHDRNRRIVMIGDFPRIDAPSLGLELPTQQAVHAAAVELIEADYLTVSFTAAADILRRALSRAGVSASAADRGLEEQMLRVIRDVLIPALPPMMLARRLLEQPVPLELVGDWPNFERSERCLLTGLGAFGVQADRWSGVAAVVHLSPWGNVSPLVLDAAEHGVTIIAPRHATDSFAGSLRSLLEGWPKLIRPAPQQILSAVKAAAAHAQ